MTRAKFKTPQTLIAWLGDMRTQIKKGGGGEPAQHAAAESMLRYAQGLIQNGRLPKTAMGKNPHRAEAGISDSGHVSQVDSLDTAKKVAQAYRFEQARKRHPRHGHQDQ